MYPPIQSPASVRVSKFIKYLTRFGWNCIVVTADRGPLRGTKEDNSLDSDVPQTVDVLRPHSFLPRISPEIILGTSRENLGVSGFIKETLYNLIFPDQYILWALSSLKTITKTAKRGDIIITTISPYSSVLTGLGLKLLKGTKWVIDYRDGWTTDPNYKFTPPKRFLEKILEFFCVRFADKITCVSEPIKTDLEKNFGVKGKIAIVENGFDTDDNIAPISLSDNTFNIIYTGMISSRTRDITQLIYAMDDIVNKQHYTNIRLYIIGNMYNQLGAKDFRYKTLRDKLNLKDNIQFFEAVPRNDALAYQRGANALLLIYTSKKDTSSIMSSKVFEYIQAKKPIIGLIGKSEVRDLILENDLGVCADPTNKDEIVKAILKIYKQPNKYYNNTELMEKYNRKNLADKLSYILEML